MLEQKNLVVKAFLVFVFVSSCLYQLLHSWIIHRQRLKFKKQNGCKEPMSRAPLKDPFLGLDFVYRTLQNARNFRYLEGTHERFQKYGITYMSKHMHYPTIHTIDPANIREGLSVRFDDYKLSSFRVNAMVPLFGNGIFTTDGERWSHLRTLLRPSFARRNIVSHLNTLENHVQNFLQSIPQDSSTFDIQKLFFCFTMDTATEFLFGHSVQTLCEGKASNKMNGITDAEFVEAYTTSCLEAAANMRLGALQHLKYSPRANRARKVAFAYVEKFVDEAIELRDSGKLSTEDAQEGGKVKYIFLRELAKETGDRIELRDQILSILLAGRDTTAALLSNLFWHLARNPNVYEKLRVEVESLHGALPTDNDIRNLKYLRCCLNEILRILPSVPANTREAIRDTVLPFGGGSDGKSPLFVKRGTHIYYSAYSMHRREDFFGDNVAEFRPERWETLRPGWEFIPFNGGPRICPGQHFSLAEASYLSIRLVQSFTKIEARDERPWTELYTMVTYSRYGTLVSLTPATVAGDGALIEGVVLNS